MFKKKNLQKYDLSGVDRSKTLAVPTRLPSEEWRDDILTKLPTIEFEVGGCDIALAGEAMIKGLEKADPQVAPLVVWLALQLKDRNEELIIKNQFKTEKSSKIKLEDLCGKMGFMKKQTSELQTSTSKIKGVITLDLDDDESDDEDDEKTPRNYNSKVIAGEKEKVIYPFVAAMLLRSVFRYAKAAQQHIENKGKERMINFYNRNCCYAPMPTLPSSAYTMLSSTLSPPKPEITTIMVPMIRKYHEVEVDPEVKSLLTYLFILPTMYRGMPPLHLAEKILHDEPSLTYVDIMQYCNTAATSEQIKRLADIAKNYIGDNDKSFWPWCRLFGDTYLSHLAGSGNLEVCIMMALLIAPEGTGGPWGMAIFTDNETKVAPIKSYLMKGLAVNRDRFMADQFDFDVDSPFNATSLEY